MWNNNAPIQQVIDQWLKIMQNGQVTDAMYQVWVEYSKSILNMITQNPLIYSKLFIRYIGSFNPDMRPYQRLSMCLQYLIKIQSII
jgi:hypothetical protein